MSTTGLNKKALELNEDGVLYALATVVAVKGSAPRHLGAKMIITKDATFDTLGGGSLEFQVIKDARECIRKGEAKTIAYPLGPLLGQCCGGEVEIFIEPVWPPKEMIIFGAGHIAEHLVPMLKELNFKITLVDERIDRIQLPVFNSADKRLNELPSDVLKSIEFSERLFMIVITHEHKHDEEIVGYCLGKPFRYLGLIGSKTKWEKFKARFLARGFGEREIDKVTTPIGLDIGSETPFEIAISIAAELIKLK